MFKSVQSYEHYRRNFKTLAEKFKLANIEMTFAGYILRQHPLALDRGQVRLFKAMFFHQGLQGIYRISL